MDEPRTTLDARFSQPDATPVAWSVTEAALDAAQLSYVSTVRADGRPHVTPVAGLWHERRFYFTTGDAEQKAVNLRTNSKVVVTTGRDDWDHGLDIVIEGDAQNVLDAATLMTLAKEWTTKWDGAWQWVVGEGGFRHPGESEPGPELILVVGVTPIKIFTFSKGPYSHTRYLFA